MTGAEERETGDQPPESGADAAELMRAHPIGTVTPDAVMRKVTSALSMSRGTFIIAVIPEVSGEKQGEPGDRRDEGRGQSAEDSDEARGGESHRP